ncbi:MAG: IclR family transcriptional regulator [Bryobacteraceae bacterium]
MSSHGLNQMPPEQATNSLDRAFWVLDAIGNAPGGLSNAELSKELKIPKSTCSFILSHLERAGYVKRLPTRRYCVGLRALLLANYALREIGFRASAESALHKLSKETNLLASLCVLEGNHVLLIDRVESPKVLASLTENLPTVAYSYPFTRAARDVGAVVPIHASSLGRVLLAALPTERRRAILNSVPLVQITPETVVSIEELLLELDLVKEQRYSITDQQIHITGRGLAVPILDRDGIVRASVGIAGSRDETVWDDMESLLKKLRLAARSISQTLI